MAEEQNNQAAPTATARVHQINELYIVLHRLLGSRWPAEVDTMLQLQQLADIAREAVRAECVAQAETADAQNAAQEAIAAAVEEMNATADLLYWLACKVQICQPFLVTPMTVNAMLQTLLQQTALPEARSTAECFVTCCGTCAPLACVWRTQYVATTITTCMLVRIHYWKRAHWPMP